MKQLFYILFLAAVIGGCNDNAGTAGKESTTTVQQESANDPGSYSAQQEINEVDVDTLGMAEFLAWKAQEAAKYRQPNGIQSAAATNDDVRADTAGFAEFKKSKAETARKAFEDSMRRAEIIAEHKKNSSPANAGTGSTKSAGGQSGSKNPSTVSDQPQVAKDSSVTAKEKKGWSNKAKGAVIGAATGAAAGAVINKRNRGVGGVIGGVVGAAAGYGIGRHKDKKDTVRMEELKVDTSDEQQ